MRFLRRDVWGCVTAFLDQEDPEKARAVVEQGPCRRGAADSPGLATGAHSSWRALQSRPRTLAGDRTGPRRRRRTTFTPMRSNAGSTLARKRGRGDAFGAGNSIVSSSARTVVYKGLFLPSHIGDFYWDLADVDFETSFAIFHQRYSTNTFPSWEIAQPFRSLAHNGEINTINSNRSWTRARERVATSTAWGDRIGDLTPFLQPDQSDSGSLDNLFELLLLSGRSLPHVKELLVPAAWENVVDLSPPRKAFSEYHAFLTEPWDGPAAVAATDGINLISFVDRNGLRPGALVDHSQSVAGRLRSGCVSGGRSPGDPDRPARSGRGALLRPPGRPGALRHRDQGKPGGAGTIRELDRDRDLLRPVTFRRPRRRSFRCRRSAPGLRLHRRRAPLGVGGNGRRQDADALDGQRHGPGGTGSTSPAA